MPRFGEFFRRRRHRKDYDTEPKSSGVSTLAVRSVSLEHEDNAAVISCPRCSTAFGDNRQSTSTESRSQYYAQLDRERREIFHQEQREFKQYKRLQHQQHQQIYSTMNKQHERKPSDQLHVERKNDENCFGHINGGAAQDDHDDGGDADLNDQNEQQHQNKKSGDRCVADDSELSSYCQQQIDLGFRPNDDNSSSSNNNIELCVQSSSDKNKLANTRQEHEDKDDEQHYKKKKKQQQGARDISRKENQSSELHVEVHVVGVGYNRDDGQEEEELIKSRSTTKASALSCNNNNNNSSSNGVLYNGKEEVDTISVGLISCSNEHEQRRDKQNHNQVAASVELDNQLASPPTTTETKIILSEREQTSRSYEQSSSSLATNSDENRLFTDIIKTSSNKKVNIDTCRSSTNHNEEDECLSATKMLPSQQEKHKCAISSDHSIVTGRIMSSDTIIIDQVVTSLSARHESSRHHRRQRRRPKRSPTKQVTKTRQPTKEQQELEYSLEKTTKNTDLCNTLQTYKASKKGDHHKSIVSKRACREALIRQQLVSWSLIDNIDTSYNQYFSVNTQGEWDIYNGVVGISNPTTINQINHTVERSSGQLIQDISDDSDFFVLNGGDMSSSNNAYNSSWSQADQNNYSPFSTSSSSSSNLSLTSMSSSSASSSECESIYSELDSSLDSGSKESNGKLVVSGFKKSYKTNDRDNSQAIDAIVELANEQELILLKQDQQQVDDCENTKKVLNINIVNYNPLDDTPTKDKKHQKESIKEHNNDKDKASRRDASSRRRLSSIVDQLKISRASSNIVNQRSAVQSFNPNEHHGDKIIIHNEDRFGILKDSEQHQQHHHHHYHNGSSQRNALNNPMDIRPSLPERESLNVNPLNGHNQSRHDSQTSGIWFSAPLSSGTGGGTSGIIVRQEPIASQQSPVGGHDSGGNQQQQLRDAVAAVDRQTQTNRGESSTSSTNAPITAIPADSEIAQSHSSIYDRTVAVAVDQGRGDDPIDDDDDNTKTKPDISEDQNESKKEGEKNSEKNDSDPHRSTAIVIERSSVPKHARSVNKKLNFSEIKAKFDGKVDYNLASSNKSSSSNHLRDLSTEDVLVDIRSYSEQDRNYKTTYTTSSAAAVAAAATTTTTTNASTETSSKIAVETIPTRPNEKQRQDYNNTTSEHKSNYSNAKDKLVEQDISTTAYKFASLKQEEQNIGEAKCIVNDETDGNVKEVGNVQQGIAATTTTAIATNEVAGFNKEPYNVSDDHKSDNQLSSQQRRSLDSSNSGDSSSNERQKHHQNEPHIETTKSQISESEEKNDKLITQANKEEEDVQQQQQLKQDFNYHSHRNSTPISRDKVRDDSDFRSTNKNNEGEHYGRSDQAITSSKNITAGNIAKILNKSRQDINKTTQTEKDTIKTLPSIKKINANDLRQNLHEELILRHKVRLEDQRRVEPTTNIRDATITTHVSNLIEKNNNNNDEPKKQLNPLGSTSDEATSEKNPNLESDLNINADKGNIFIKLSSSPTDILNSSENINSITGGKEEDYKTYEATEDINENRAHSSNVPTEHTLIDELKESSEPSLEPQQHAPPILNETQEFVTTLSSSLKTTGINNQETPNISVHFAESKQETNSTISHNSELNQEQLCTLDEKQLKIVTPDAAKIEKKKKKPLTSKFKPSDVTTHKKHKEENDQPHTSGKLSLVKKVTRLFSNPFKSHKSSPSNSKSSEVKGDAKISIEQDTSKILEESYLITGNTSDHSELEFVPETTDIYNSNYVYPVALDSGASEFSLGGSSSSPKSTASNLSNTTQQTHQHPKSAQQPQTLLISSGSVQQTTSSNHTKLTATPSVTLTRPSCADEYNNDSLFSTGGENILAGQAEDIENNNEIINNNHTKLAQHSDDNHHQSSSNCEQSYELVDGGTTIHSQTSKDSGQYSSDFQSQPKSDHLISSSQHQHNSKHIKNNNSNLQQGKLQSSSSSSNQKSPLLSSSSAPASTYQSSASSSAAMFLDDVIA